MGASEKNIGYFSTNRESFSSFIEQLKTYRESEEHRGKSKFSGIEDISNIPASEKISKELFELIKNNQYSGEALITLFPDLSKQEQQTIKMAIDEYLRDREGEIISEVDSASGKMLRIKAKNEGVLTQIAESFLSVQAVDSVQEVLVESTAQGMQIEDSVIISPNNADAAVCIFDSGVIADSKFLSNSMIGYEEPLGPAYNVEHGTMVASRIIYGNSLRDDISKATLVPDVKVLSVCIITRDNLGNRIPPATDHILKVIRKPVEKWHKKIKVYNLSMNFVIQNTQQMVTIDENKVSPVAAEIDKLCKTYEILFVLTTGNYPLNLNFLPSEEYPKYFLREDTRICCPSEAMLALTVGSIADRENNGSMARRDFPSPFTRKGPGFNQYRKPDVVVAPGGNYTENWKNFDDLSVVGISGDGKHLAYSNGTSFAAPLVSRLAAKIFSHIPNATPDMVRALLIHSAKVKNSDMFDSEMAENLMGNGFPDTSCLFNSTQWDQNYFFQGKIGYRKIIRLPFFVPSCLIDRKVRKKLRIRFTLAFSPETNRALKNGYCKSHLRTCLYKKNKKDNELRDASADKKSTEVIKDRYSTIIRYDKTFSVGMAAGEWELLIEQESRWTITEAEVPFAIVLTVSDPVKDEKIDIYNAIRIESPIKYSNLVDVRTSIRT
ncbi:MAG: S8 family peptidase [Proteobacteria bacterium]|nr:S8 family peptidase [Pseudomonadota bacterium]